jgi:predicted HAD superfamily phosphohydrolase YqeG
MLPTDSPRSQAELCSQSSMAVPMVAPLHPDRLSGHIHALTDLNVELLAVLGIQGILFQGRSQTFQLQDAALMDWIAQAKQQALKFLWLATPYQAAEVHAWCDQVEMPILNTKNKLMVLALREALACFEMEPRQMLLVSDRPVWELWDAHLLGMPVVRIG